jgi:hypothetical protein
MDILKVFLATEFLEEVLGKGKNNLYNVQVE